MDISREKMQAAFGIDSTVQIPLEVAARDPGYPLSRQQLRALINNKHTDVSRFIKRPNRHQIEMAIGKNPRVAKYCPIKYDIQYMIKRNPSIIKYVDENHPRYEYLCTAAVEQDGLVLYYINKQTKDMCFVAVRQNGLALRYCKFQNVAIQTAAVLQNEEAIFYVDPVSEDFYINILVEYPCYWIFIKDTPNNRRRAIIKNSACIAFMSNVDDMFIKQCITDGRAGILRFMEHKFEILQFAINKEADNIMFIQNQTPELQLMAVQKDPKVIEFIRKPTSDALRLAIQMKPELIKSVEQTEELCKIAITLIPKLFADILKPTDAITKLAVELDGMNLRYVDVQTPELCETAIRQNPKSFQFVLDQTSSIARLSISLDPSNVYYLLPSLVDDIAYENKWGAF